MTKDEALKLALEALESSRVFVTTREKIKHPEGVEWYDQIITAIKKALAQPEREPVACKECHLKDTVYDLLGDLKVANLKLSVRAQRTWVELTMDDFTDILKSANGLEVWELFKAVETKAREKNNG
jgi:uncharacterized protein YqgV (UPF0045/DUF77 family)